MKLILPAIVLLAIFFFPSNAFAQQHVSKTLLWRISGNGLVKPSYLYGTMHLKDRRLFFFGDSVYKSLEASAGFAMELDPNEMMDSVFSKMNEKDTTSLLRQLIDKEKYKSISKKLEKKFVMPADRITRKKIITERQNWYTQIHKKDDMNAVVDLYLYDLAHRQGKWVGGIEDVNDQFGIQDELGKDLDILKYVEEDNEEKKKSHLEKMINIYTAEDLEKLAEMINGSQSQNDKDLLLIKRNIKMATRMDSLAHIRNSFFAIGAAHLSEETGLIRLLQNKGFTVEPVFSSKKINPENYSYTVKEMPWIKFSDEDSAYTVEMPGKVSDLKVPGDVMTMKVYADLASNITYITGFTFLSMDESPEQTMDRMVKSLFAKEFEKKEQKKITNNGISGMEFVSVRDNIYYRLQLFTTEGKIFMIMAGSDKKEALNTKDVERFLSSLAMNQKANTKPNTWVAHRDEVKAFEITFPKKVNIDKLDNSPNNTTETTTYTAMDVPNVTYYMVVVNDTKKGFIIVNDSVVFNSKLNYYKVNNAEITELRQFNYEGNPAMSFSAQLKKDGVTVVTRILIICRGNRAYSIAIVTQKGKEDFPDVNRFFKSFKLLPYKEAIWSKQMPAPNTFSTWAPSGFDIAPPDTAGLQGVQLKEKLTGSQKLVQFIGNDPNSSVSYNINVHAASKYFWANTDSSFLEEQLKTYFSDTSSSFAKQNPGNFDSLIYKKNVVNGNVKGIEILVKNAAESYNKRVRILPHGDSSYHLFLLAPYAVINNENNKKFFEEFRFSIENIPSGILKSKTSLILDDLASADSVTKEEAISVLYDTKFEVIDLPLLCKAYLKQYPADTTLYNTVNEKIGRAISAIRDSSVVSFVKENYFSASTNRPELRMDMIEILASQKTKPATNVVKTLLLKDPPVTGDPASFIYGLSDSLLLAKDLFPEAGKLFGDSILGAGMLKIASELIDSNLLDRDILQNNLDGIMHTANAGLLQLQKDKKSYLRFVDNTIDVLQKMNSRQSIKLLNGFLNIANQDVKQKALLALLKAGQTVAPAQIHKIAADKGMRTNFYKELKVLGKQQLFSADQLTQQQFAEGYLYNYSQDEDASSTSCKLIGERTALVKGIQQRYYLFKVSFDFDEEVASYLGICGGFNLDRKKVELLKIDSGVKIMYDEKYAAPSINKVFTEFIAGENKPVAATIK